MLAFIFKNNNVINPEYVFALINIISLFPVLFLSNTIYSMFFSLELISCLVFYKFSVSNFWFKKNKRNFIEFNFNKFNKLLPKTYINTLFFQYWTAFFSSVLIIYFLISLISVTGTSELALINHLILINSKINYLDSLDFYFLFFILIFGIFLKLGITPVHLYKIEVYKGIPLISLYLYTTLYFFIYFIYFIYLFLINLSSIIIIIWLLILIFTVSGILYIITLFFNNLFLKTFFAYSTILNGLNVLFVLICS